MWPRGSTAHVLACPAAQAQRTQVSKVLEAVPDRAPAGTLDRHSSPITREQARRQRGEEARNRPLFRTIPIRSELGRNDGVSAIVRMPHTPCNQQSNLAEG